MFRWIFTRAARIPSQSLISRNLLTKPINFKFSTTVPDLETSDQDGEQDGKYWEKWEKGIEVLNDAKKKSLTEEEYLKLSKEIPYLDVQRLDPESADAVKFLVGDLANRADDFSLHGVIELSSNIAMNDTLNIEPYIVPYWRVVTQFLLKKYSKLKLPEKIFIISHYSMIPYYDAKIKELIDNIIESLKWIPPQEYEKLPPVALFGTARALRHKGWGDTLFINTLCVLVVRNKYFWGMNPRIVSHFLIFLEEEKHEEHIQVLIKCTEKVLTKCIDKGKFNSLKSSTKLARDIIGAEHVSKEFKLKVEQHFLNLINDRNQPKNLDILLAWLNIFARHTFQLPELEQKLKDLIFEFWKDATEIELAHMVWLLSPKLNDNVHHIKMLIITIENKVRKRNWTAPEYLEAIMIELNNSRIVYPKLMKMLEDIAFGMLEDPETNPEDILKIISCFPPQMTNNPKFHEKAAERLANINYETLVDERQEEIRDEYEEMKRNEVTNIEIEEEDLEHQIYGYAKNLSQDEETARMKELKKIMEKNKKDNFYGFNSRQELIKIIEESITEERIYSLAYLLDLITTVYENKYLQKPEIIEKFEGEMIDKIVMLNEFNMFRPIFAFLRLNCASIAFYNRCIEVLNLSMQNFAPMPTARATLAFGMIGKEEFFMQMLQKIRKFITSNEMVRVQTNFGVVFRFRGVMSAFFRFDENFPAFALAEMVWGLAAFEIKDREIWNEKLYQILLELPGVDIDLRLNKWSRARDYSDKEQTRCLDPFDYGLLMQALALNPPQGAKHKVFLNKLKNLVKGKSENFIKKMGFRADIRPGFLESVKEVAKNLHFDIDDRERHFLGMKLDLKLGQKEILLYDKDHYLYKSNGYESRTGEKDMFKYWIMKKNILKAADIPFIEIYQGEWEKMLPEEQEEFLHNEYKKKAKKE
ncbi:unnamed protein product [Blepharisma stoltei]|uniref:Uncharacterized protein n=1 Tax=Blepharisma stoltei TaxID=1481888 RepID=A0AAU9JJD7_9CILI|nr:unnamed protein product [Blepharisma stoltei]